MKSYYHLMARGLHKRNCSMKATCLTFVLCFSFALSPAWAAPPVKRIVEDSLREIASIEGIYSDFAYLVDLIDHLKSCGVTGEVTQIVEQPKGDIPDIRGLHFLVRNVDVTAPCYNPHWQLLDNPLSRDRIKRIVRSGGLVFIGLQTFGHFHSVAADPGTNEFAGHIGRAVGFESEPPLVLFLGRQAVFGDVNGHPLTDDLLELAAWRLPAATLLTALELISQAKGADWLAPQSGLIEVRSQTTGEKPKRARRELVSKLKDSFSGVSLFRDTAIDLLALLKPYVSPRDLTDLAEYFLATCESHLEPRKRRH